MEKKLDLILEELQSVKTEQQNANKRFDAIDKQFEEVDKRFDKLEQTNEVIIQTLENQNTFLIKHEKLLTQLVASYEKQEQRLEKQDRLIELLSSRSISSKKLKSR